MPSEPDYSTITAEPPLPVLNGKVKGNTLIPPTSRKKWRFPLLVLRDLSVLLLWYSGAGYLGNQIFPKATIWIPLSLASRGHSLGWNVFLSSMVINYGLLSMWGREEKRQRHRRLIVVLVLSSLLDGLLYPIYHTTYLELALHWFLVNAVMGGIGLWVSLLIAPPETAKLTPVMVEKDDTGRT